VVGPLLFRNLFEYGPELITLFDFTEDQDWENSEVFQAHYRLVLTAVEKAVKSLRNLGSLVIYLKDLGRDHMLRGVNKEHYGILSLALQATFKMGIGNQYTFELQRAW
jgi:hemoglobin-like flavoprotein